MFLLRKKKILKHLNDLNGSANGLTMFRYCTILGVMETQLMLLLLSVYFTES